MEWTPKTSRCTIFLVQFLQEITGRTIFFNLLDMCLLNVYTYSTFATSATLMDQKQEKGCGGSNQSISKWMLSDPK